jgi:CHAT domain-containing protein/hemolysin activation/secretion protein
MSDHWLQFVRRGFPPTAMLLILIGQALPTCGQEAKPIPANAPQAKPSPLPSASPLPKKEAEKEEKESRVLVSEVVVKGAMGKLQEEVYKAAKTKPGRTTTSSKLQEDVQAINATGYFSNVKVVPEDTPLGVRVTFEVKLNPILQAVKVEGNRVLPQDIVDKTFSRQYGQVLNLNVLQAGIKTINKWYTDNGYVLGQVLDKPAISPEGLVTLQVAEGEVEGIRVRFINKEGDDKDARGNPIRGRTRDFVVIREFQTKPGDIFNRTIVEQDLKRAFGLGIFEDVRLSLQPSEIDPRKVVVVANVAEAEDEAEWLFNTANQLSQKNTNDSKQQAIANYQKLLQLHRMRKDKKNEAIVLHRTAAVYSDLEVYDQALDFYNQSLRLAQTNNLPALEVLTLSDIGNTYYRRRNYSQAFDTYSQALQLTQSLENTPVEEIYGGFGFAFGQSSLQGRFSDIYFSPVSVKKTTGNVPTSDLSKFLIQFRLGELYQRLGDYPQAVMLFKSALPQLEMQAAKDKKNALVYKLPEVFNLAYLASVYADLGDEGQALIYRNEATQGFLKYSDTLKQQQGGGDQLLSFFGTMLDTASSIDGVGETKLDNSMQKFFKSFSASETSALFSVGIGDRYAERGQDAQALKVYEQALAELKNLKNPTNKPIVLQAQVKALNGMGKVYGNSASQQTAIGFHQQALKVLQASDSSAQTPVLQAETLNLLGKAYFRAKQFPQARNAYTQAIALSTTAKDSAKIAESLLGMAEVERAVGNFAPAQTHIEDAITHLEAAALTKLKRQPLQPATQPSSSVDTSTDLKGQPVFSISAKPQPKALTAVGDATGNFNSYKDSTALLTSNRNYYEFYVDLLMERYRQTGAKQYETQAFLASERAKAQSLRIMLKRRDRPNDSSSSTLPTSASLREVQASLDDDTILLEFFLGKQRSYLWAVTKDDISSYVLPSQSQIDLASRSFYEYLTNPNLRVRPDSTAQVGMNLSRLILGSVAPKLVGKKRLLVVGDGGLQYIPFSALPIPLAGVKSNTPNLASIVDPLLVRHEVVNLPSASTLIAIRQNRAKRIAPTKTLAVLADPIFGREDERLGAAQTKQLLAGNADVEQFYPRLPGTQRQAEQILALVPEAQRSQKFGFDASRQTALSPDLGQYRMIHFATHGILDSQRPERSGMILSMVNERGELQRSLLSPPDIFNTLKLSADLVVLNGCRTGLGTGANKEYSDRQNTYQIQATFTIMNISAGSEIQTLNGEGVVGLTGSFLYAGADRVVASLWSVEEKATSDLMVRFYTNMLNGRDGKKLTPAAALREAQLSMWKERRWESPYDWAGFVLQGEWR